MYCSQCGMQAPPDARYCAKCGATLVSAGVGAPPEVAGAIQERRRRRPRWVWLIAIFYVLSAGFTLLSFAAMLTGAILLNEAQRDYFASLSAFDYFASLAIGIISITGAILLFLLRRAALPLFLAALVLNLSLTAVHLFTKPFAAALGGSGLVGAFLGWCVLAAVCLYARNLKIRGVLK